MCCYYIVTILGKLSNILQVSSLFPAGSGQVEWQKGSLDDQNSAFHFLVDIYHHITLNLDLHKFSSYFLYDFSPLI